MRPRRGLQLLEPWLQRRSQVGLPDHLVLQPQRDLARLVRLEQRVHVLLRGGDRDIARVAQKGDLSDIDRLAGGDRHAGRGGNRPRS